MENIGFIQTPNVWTTAVPMINNDYYEIDDNKILIAPNTAPSSGQYFVFCLDFVSNKITEIVVTPFNISYYSQTGYYATFYYIDNMFIFCSFYQGTTHSYLYDILENFPVYLVYNGYKYEVQQKVAVE